MPQKQPRRGRLWLADGNCIRLRPLRRNHVWCWDFVMHRSDDGRPIKMLTLIDEFTHECLAIHIARRIRATDVIDSFADVKQARGVPEHNRSGNGPEMIAKNPRRWRVHYNMIRPHGSLGYRPPAPETAYAKPLIAEEPQAA